VFLQLYDVGHRCDQVASKRLKVRLLPRLPRYKAFARRVVAQNINQWKEMKPHIVAAVLLASIDGYSGQIDVLSQSYSISGLAWVFYGLPPDATIFDVPKLPFSSSGPTPVYLTDIYPSLPSLGSGFANTYATGSVNPSAVFLAVSVDYAVTGPGSIAQITFRPAESGTLDLGLAGQDSGVDATWFMSLLDVTTGAALLTRHKFGDNWVIEEHFFEVDSSHVYMLTDTAVGSLHDEASVVTTLEMKAVPELCSTMLLLAMGLGGLVGLNEGLWRAACVRILNIAMAR